MIMKQSMRAKLLVQRHDRIMKTQVFLEADVHDRASIFGVTKPHPMTYLMHKSDPDSDGAIQLGAAF